MSENKISVTTIREAIDAMSRANVPLFNGTYYCLADIPLKTESELGEMDRDAWRRRICDGIDATRRAAPITAAELRARIVAITGDMR